MEFKAQQNSLVKLEDVKNAGFSINLIETKNNYKGVQLSKNDSKWIAVQSKSFEGEITLNTYVIEGENAQGEARLYLTNAEGGVKVGAAL